MLNCSRPELPALLEALGPVFDLNSIRPVVHMSTPTNVSIGFTLYAILGVDEKAQVLTTYIWQEEMWRNEFVSWDADECGSEHITLPRSKLWMPDVVINEFMEENSAPYVPYVYMFHDGTVHDSQPFKVVSSCNLNVYTFPFDVQNCTFTYNSYIHRMSAIQLKLAWTIEDIQKHSLSLLATMGEWQLEEITVEKPLIRGTDDDRDPYDVLYFYIRVRRRATLYVVNLILPSCFLITVDLFSFLLPPQSSDRSSFKMTLILGYTVFLLMMNDLLPTTGNGIPLINVFFCLCLALMVASLLETILITNLLYSGGNLSPVPRWVQVFVLHMLGSLVGLPPKPRGQGGTVIPNPAAHDTKACSLVAVEGKTDERATGVEGPEVEDKALEQLRSLGKDLQAIRLQVEQQLTGNQSSEEWLQVGFIIDRLLFIFYIIFISVSFITIIGVWVMSYKKF